MPTNNSPFVHYLALLVVLLALVLTGLGAFLNSSGYSQAIPTWPLVNGQLIPEQMVGGILWEFNHRATAALTGVLSLLLCFWIGTRDSRPIARRIAWGAAALILFQILMGGMGAMTDFPVWVSVVHSIGSGLFFALAVALAVVTCPTCRPPGESRFEAKTIRGARGLTSMVILQYVVGAFLRHTESGGIYMIALLLHVLLAVGILVSAFTTGLAVIRQSQETHINVGAYAVLTLVLAQLVMGLMVLVSGPGTSDFPGQAPVAYVAESVGHVVTGTALLGASLFLAIVTRQHAAER